MSISPLSIEPRVERELVGPWHFQIDSDDRGEREGWYASDFDRSIWTTVPVPRAWDLYDQALWCHEGVGWFATEIPSAWVEPGRWQRLRFASVGTHARVWLNGQFLGEHIGRYLPFEFAVTPYLRRDRPNVLVVRVDNAHRPEWLPGGDVVEWVQYGGILQPVCLISTAQTFILDLGITTTPAGTGARIVCDVAIVNRDRQGFNGEVTVTLPTESAPASAKAPVTCTVGQTTTISLTIDLPRVQLWSPDSPILYPLRAELTTASGAIDALTERIGIRAVEVRGAEILLNGQPLQIRGVNRYDEYEGFGPTPPMDLVRADLEQIKRSGVNLIRVHYPQDASVLHLMDEIGLLLLEEVPLNWWPTAPGPGQTDELTERRADVIDAAEQALTEMIRRDRNRACVIAWSMGNECATHTPTGIVAMRRLLRRAHVLDPTQPATFVACGPIEENLAFDEADFVSANLYPGVFGGDLAYHLADMDARVKQPMQDRLRQLRTRFPSKPLVVTEFGARGIRGLRGDTRLTEDHQAAYIRAAWKAIEKVPGVCGGILWCWADYYHRLHVTGPGGQVLRTAHGPYGVVTVDRRPKKALREIVRLFGGTASEG